MNYIKISDVVNELSLARKDDNRQEYLRYLVLSKTVLKDLKVKYVNDYKRVYLAVDAATNTVRIPFDFQRLRTLSVIENCTDRYGKCTEKVIPLVHNPYINITHSETIKCENECGCELIHPVCQELASYETIEEEIVIAESPEILGTRQTILKTCANGDIIKEVTEPVQKWIQGSEVCDYAIEMVQTPRTVCDYTFAVTVPVVSSFFITFTINGEEVTSPSVNITTFQDYMEGLGWVFVSQVLGLFTFVINDAVDIYGLEGFYVNSLGDTTDFLLERHCVQIDTIPFPYTIVSYVLNGETVTLSPADVILNQTEQDAFFTGLGFIKVDSTHYTKESATDVYFSMIIQTGDSVPETININFIQSSCTRPLVSAGFENQLFTDVLCNVEVKDCGCICPTEENISCIVENCSSFLNCCQTGCLTGYSGWGYVPSCCPTNSEQPYNKFGTYNLDEKNFVIYLNSVNASRVLLAYDTDGSCESEYVFPEYMMEAFKAGIAFRHAQYNEEITPFRRRELEINYTKEKTEVQSTWTDPIRMADLVNALKTRKYPY